MDFEDTKKTAGLHSFDWWFMLGESSAIRLPEAENIYQMSMYGSLYNRTTLNPLIEVLTFLNPQGLYAVQNVAISVLADLHYDYGNRRDKAERQYNVALGLGYTAKAQVITTDYVQPGMAFTRLWLNVSDFHSGLDSHDGMDIDLARFCDHFIINQVLDNTLIYMKTHNDTKHVLYKACLEERVKYQGIKVSWIKDIATNFNLTLIGAEFFYWFVFELGFGLKVFSPAIMQEVGDPTTPGGLFVHGYKKMYNQPDKANFSSYPSLAQNTQPTYPSYYNKTYQSNESDNNDDEGNIMV